uniref:Uncharacterized protein n=1 Tax=Chromera velia CCMP2878 TaxID=1169474 RepID=A0A0G4HJT5_9ALVE|eukprot:Cvel_7179.t1-p1 / transcript=Cvel_7179.t1 / gene=Cvel_7179 / organism=Chromera_velia_CCMP2878 / gene_product=hypothetical protein / transcript_product=hypothetical protein / location=Cvel_scaffold369:57427-57774(-) / protein_length=116 / sequence_SO=supercontig / SO=protein_coding / is_pseudo=false
MQVMQTPPENLNDTPTSTAPAGPRGAQTDPRAEAVVQRWTGGVLFRVRAYLESGQPSERRKKAQRAAEAAEQRTKRDPMQEARVAEKKRIEQARVAEEKRRADEMVWSEVLRAGLF